jgi:predicted nicotinamide N-methyase
MENRVALEISESSSSNSSSSSGCCGEEVTDEELRSLALLDYTLGLTLKRQYWSKSAGSPAAAGSSALVTGTNTVTALVEYHLENVAHTACEQLDGSTLREGLLQVRARPATAAESAELLAAGSNDSRTEFGGRFVARDAAKLRRRVQLAGGRVSVELQATTEGGTGGKLWDATPILAEWALQHKDLWRGRVVHELGAGLGLPGLAIALGAEPRRVVLSDCVQECLSVMENNVAMNGLQAKVDVRRFDWRDVSATTTTTAGCAGLAAHELEPLRADVVICSDVVYSREVAGWLPQAVKACLRPGGVLFALLPLSRMGCRECLQQLGELLTPFDPPGTDPDPAGQGMDVSIEDAGGAGDAGGTAMAGWIREHLGANQLGHRIYGFRAPAADGAAGATKESGAVAAAAAPVAAAAAPVRVAVAAAAWEITTKEDRRRYSSRRRAKALGGLGEEGNSADRAEGDDCGARTVVVAQLRLPLLDSVADADLRITRRTISFEAPPNSSGGGTSSCYERVLADLPMAVDTERCAARFSRRSRTLRVALPAALMVGER